MKQRFYISIVFTMSCLPVFAGSLRRDPNYIFIKLGIIIVVSFISDILRDVFKEYDDDKKGHKR